MGIEHTILGAGMGWGWEYLDDNVFSTILFFTVYCLTTIFGGSGKFTYNQKGLKNYEMSEDSAK